MTLLRIKLGDTNYGEGKPEKDGELNFLEVSRFRYSIFSDALGRPKPKKQSSQETTSSLKIDSKLLIMVSTVNDTTFYL
jgi:hypothetical protein